MLSAIADMSQRLHKNFGFKAAGGVAKLHKPCSYVKLTQLIYGADKITPECLRIGASSL